MGNDNKLNLFYNSLTANKNITGLPKDFETFESTLRDPAKSQLFYNSLRANKNIKGLPESYDQFVTGLSLTAQPEQPEEERTGFWEGLGKKTAAGVAGLGEMVYKTPQFIESVINAPYKMIAESTINRELKKGKIDQPTADYMLKNTEKMVPRFNLGNFTPIISPKTVGEMIADGKVSTFFEEKGKELNESVNRYDQTAWQYIKDNEYGKALGVVTYGIAESFAPTMAAAFVPGGWAALGIGTGAEKYDEVKDRDDMAEAMKQADAITTGIFEALFEKFGTAEMSKLLKEAYKKAGKKGLEEIISNKGTLGLIAKGYKKFGVWLAPIHEGLSETLTTIGQNAASKYSGESPDISIWDNAVDSFLIGSGMGSAFAATEKLAERVKRKEIGQTEQPAAPPTPEQLINAYGEKLKFGQTPLADDPQPTVIFADTKLGQKVILTRHNNENGDDLFVGYDAEALKASNYNLDETKPIFIKATDILERKDVPYQEWFNNELNEYNATLKQGADIEAQQQSPFQPGQQIEWNGKKWIVGNITTEGLEVDEIDEEGMPGVSDLITPDKFKEIPGYQPQQTDQQQPGQPEAAGTQQPVQPAQQARKLKIDDKNDITIIPGEDENTFSVDKTFNTGKEAETTANKLNNLYPKVDFKVNTQDSGDPFTPDTYTITAKIKPFWAKKASPAPGETATGQPAEQISGESQGKAKPEPHQMTRSEYVDAATAHLSQRVRPEYRATLENKAKEEHEKAVTKAIEEGAEIPENVMADYPQLFQQPAATEEAKQEEVPAVEPQAEQEQPQPADVKTEVDLTKANTEINTKPTEGQKEAGNYKKGHVNIQGLDITIENPQGSVRSGTNKQGNEWSVLMNNSYGYFRRTEGKDGDQVDVFIGDKLNSDKVWIVDQVDPETGSFDEHKVMLGFETKEDAVNNYQANYDPSWKGLGKVTEFSIDEFKKWLGDGKRTKVPASESVPQPKVAPKPKFKPQSRTAKALAHEPADFTEAVLQFFVNGGKVSREDFIRFSGLDGKDIKQYNFLLSKDGVAFDVFNEAIDNSFGMENDAMAMENAIVDIITTYGSKSKMLAELESRISDHNGQQPAPDQVDNDYLPEVPAREIDPDAVDNLIDKVMSSNEIMAIFDNASDLLNEDGSINWTAINDGIDNNPGYFTQFPFGLNEDEINTLKQLCNNEEQQRILQDRLGKPDSNQSEGERDITGTSTQGDREGDGRDTQTGEQPTEKDGGRSDQAEIGKPEELTPEAPEPAKPSYGSTNTVFTSDAAAKAREILRKKLGNLNVGIDPETMQAGITLAGYHIEAGARQFSAFAKAMVQDMGEAIKPYLKSFYNAVRDWPGFNNDGMDDYGTVSGIDMDKVLVPEEVKPEPLDLSEILSKYGWTSKNTDSKIQLFNRNGKHVADVLVNRSKYTITDTDGKKILAGNKDVATAIDKVAKEYFYAKEEVKSESEPKPKKQPEFAAELFTFPEDKKKPNVNNSTGENLDKPEDNSTLTNNNQQDVPDTARNSEQDSQNSKVELPTDKGSVSGNGRESGSTGIQPERADNSKQQQSERSQGDSDSPAITPGTTGDNEILQSDQQQADLFAGSFNGTGSSIFGTEGDNGANTDGNEETDTDPEPVSENFAKSLDQKRIAQQAAESVEVKPMDIGNIRESLPFLLPEQQEDVLRAETRFFSDEHKNDVKRGLGKGYMFTNGTGTGKTYTGLGIAKRFTKLGKGRILIVTPSQQKVSDWSKDALNLGLNATPLESTSEAGEGTVVTTYANFRDNEEILRAEWDLIIYDESHRLMEEKSGAHSATTMTHYAASNRDFNTTLSKLQQIHPLWKKEVELNRNIRSEAKLRNNLDMMQEHYMDSLAKEKEMEAELSKIKDEQNKILPQLEAKAKELTAKTKVVFLSATPFKGHFNLRYANKYLFDWGNEETHIGYSRVDAESRFFLDNFGSAYTWKYHRLQTNPKGSAEAIAMQETLFSEKLTKDGVFSGRAIDSPMDYGREFPKVAGGFNSELFNKAFSDIFNYTTKEFEHLRGYVREVFYDYQFSTQLFEVMKASMNMDRIQQHLDLGRKVVIFHRRHQANVSAPFALSLQAAEITANTILNDENSSDEKKDNAKQTLAEIQNFRDKYSDLLEYEQTLDYRPAIEQIQERFGDRVGFFNGTVPQKKRADYVKRFNTDDSGLDIIVVQEESGKEGISLHDVSGKNQRVLINLALPISSITALQIEGRTYRIGNASNAIFEYPLLGIDIELSHFGKNLNKKLSTTENLAMGDQARDLLRSFAEGVLFNSNTNSPTAEQGKGGKDYDKKIKGAISIFQKAKAYYYANIKRNSRSKSQEGQDYYPTPEPIGQKMIEWLKLKEGQNVLEPSAGHGAIAMWVPQSNNLTAIEPSFELSSKLDARAGGGTKKILNGTFESHNIINKYDGIAMNPPYGSAGKTAADHLQKAIDHLRDGGRIVAIIPDGPSMDKRMDKILNGTDEKEKRINPDIYLRGEIKLPSVTFERAGTAVRTKIVILDKISDHELAKEAYPKHIDLSDIKSVEDLFDAIENINMPDKIQKEGNAENTPENVNTENSTAVTQYLLQKHSKTGAPLHTVKLVNRVPRETYLKLNDIATNLGGYFSTYSKQGMQPGFIFTTKEDADKFIERTNNDLSSLNEPSETYIKEKGVYTQAAAEQTLPEGVSYVSERASNDDAGQLNIWGQGDYNATPDPGNVTYVERILTNRKKLSFIGDPLTGSAKIKGSDDVAFLFKNFENAATENFFTVFVDKNGNYKVLYISTGGITGTVSDLRLIAAGAREFNTKKVYLVHNHPSGALQPSDADMNITRKVQQMFEDSGIESVEHVIIDLDSGNYVLLNPNHNVESLDKDQYSAKNKVSPVDVYQFDRQKLYVPSSEKTRIRSSMDVAEYLSKMKRGTTPKMSALILDRGNNITKYLLYDESITKETLANELQYEVGKHGTSVILASNKGLQKGLVNFVSKKLNTSDSQLLDVIIVEQNDDIIKSYNSWADEGILNEPKDEYRKNNSSTLFKLSDKLYFHPVQKALDVIKQDKATPQQWKAMLLKNGAKQAELDWMGWDDIAGKPSLTRADIQNWIDQNNIEIKEVVKGGLTEDQIQNKKKQIEQQFTDSGFEIETFFDELSITKEGEPLSDEELENLPSELDAAAKEYASLNGLQGVENRGTAYEQYTLPGGEDYRELLLTMPGDGPISIDNEIKEIVQNRDGEWEIKMQDGRKFKYPDAATSQEARNNFEQDLRTDRINVGTRTDYSKTYQSPHWNEPNILAHVRFNSRTDADGKNILFIEEIQSDWAQKGKKEGFKGNVLKTDLSYIEYRTKLWEKYNVESVEALQGKATADELSTLSDLWNKEDNISGKISDGVPDMPFKQTDQWAGLVLRRMIRYAIDNGFDSIAWTPGEVQADRYDISTKVRHIAWEKNEDGTYNINAPFPTSPGVYKEDLTIKEVEDIVGKEIAAKIEKGEGVKKESDGGYRDWTIIEGDDLKIGGKGMIGFYDQILPSIANKIGKKFGSQVGTTGITDGNLYKIRQKNNGYWEISDENNSIIANNLEFHQLAGYQKQTYTVHTLPITPSMFDAYRNGIPLFRVDNNVSGDELLDQLSGGTKYKDRFEREMRGRIELLSQALNTPINIVNTKEDLPQHIKDEIKKQDYNKKSGINGIPGLYDSENDQVYVVLSDVTDIKEVTKVVLHEVVAHKGIRELLGNEFKKVLDNVYDSMTPEEISYLEKVYKTKDAETIADEYIAWIAEEQIDQDMFDRVIAWIRQLLRKYFKIDYSINDIVDMLRRSREALENKSKPNAKNYDIAGAYLEDLTAWHGSPYNIRRFNSKKIGTGEGNQLFGYGLYFTDKKEIAEFYAKSNANITDYMAKAKEQLSDKETAWIEKALARTKWDYPETVKYLNEKMESFNQDPKIYNRFKRILRYIARNPLPENRYLYSILISKGKTPSQMDWINWNDHLKNSQVVKIADQIKKESIAGNDIEQALWGLVPASKIYDILSRKLGSPKAASSFLSRAGIDGMVYPIGTIQGKQQPGNNYVVFNDNDISIKGKTRFKIDPEDPTKPPTGTNGPPVNLIRSSKDKNKELWQNKMLSVRKWMNQIKGRGGVITDISNPYIQENLSHGAVKHAIENYDEKFLSPLEKAAADIMKATGMNYDQLNEYMMAKHARERNEYLEEKTGREVNSGMESDKADEIAAAYEAKMTPEMISEFWKAINKATKFSVDRWLSDGFISPETHDKIKNQYKYYVPLRNWQQTEADNMYSYQADDIGKSVNPLKKAKGRTSLADDPLQYIVNMAHSAIVMGEKNRIKQHAARLIRNNKDMKDLHRFKRVYYIWDGTIDEETGKQNYVEVFDKPEPELWEKGYVKTHLDLGHTVRRSVTQAGQHEVDVFIGGDKYTMILPADVAAALNKVPSKWDNVAFVLRDWKIGQFTRWLSFNFTSKNPAFILLNQMRDLQYATLAHFIKGDTREAGQFIKVLPKARKAIIQHIKGKGSVKDATYQMYLDFLRMGGETGYVHLKDVDQLEKEIKKQLDRLTGRNSKADKVLHAEFLRNMGQWMEHMAVRSENLSRFATYIVAKEQGLSDRQAAFAAKEITVNFNRKGQISGLLGSLFAFFNASAQGGENIYRMGKEHKNKFFAIGAAGMAMGFLEALFNGLWGGDDEDGINRYAGMNDYLKFNNFVFMVPGTEKFATVPLPHGFRWFHSLGVLAYQTMFMDEKTKGAALKDGLSNLFSSVSPVNPVEFVKDDGTFTIRPIVPTIAVPFYDIAINQTYTGAPVHKTPFTSALDGRIANTALGKGNVNGLVKSFTDGLFKLGGGNPESGSKYYMNDDGKIVPVSNIFDKNPSDIEHVIEYYLGGRGQFWNDVMKTTQNIIESADQHANDASFVQAMKEINMNEFPVMKSLVRQPWKKSVYTRYYDIVNDIENYKTMVNMNNKSLDPESEAPQEYLPEYQYKIELLKDVKRDLKSLDEDMQGVEDPGTIQEIKDIEERLIRNFIDQASKYNQE